MYEYYLPRISLPPSGSISTSRKGVDTTVNEEDNNKQNIYIAIGVVIVVVCVLFYLYFFQYLPRSKKWKARKNLTDNLHHLTKHHISIEDAKNLSKTIELFHYKTKKLPDKYCLFDKNSEILDCHVKVENGHA